MIDCTKTENFFKEKCRMCKTYDRCCNCPMDEARKQESAHNMWCDEFCAENPKKAIEVVQKWSDKHPQKTMLDDFKEKHPNAPINNDGTPKICPCRLGYVKSEDCPQNADGESLDCADCWNRPYEDGGEQE